MEHVNACFYKANENYCAHNLEFDKYYIIGDMLGCITSHAIIKYLLSLMVKKLFILDGHV